MSVAFSIEGPASAPPVLLLHSIATSRELWLPQLAAWAGPFRLIRADLPGHGASPLLKAGAGFEDYADALVWALDKAGIRQTAVVGLSFGAMIALQLAARHPDRVSGLVMANCLVQTPPAGAQMWRDRIAAVEAGGMAAQAEPTLARWFTPDFAAASPLTVDWVRRLILATPPQGF